MREQYYLPHHRDRRQHLLLRLRLVLLLQLLRRLRVLHWLLRHHPELRGGKRVDAPKVDFGAN